MPCDMKRYPPTWPAIRERIRQRAGDRCEKCGVPNHAIGYREADGRFVKLANRREDCGMATDTAMADGFKVIEIVLTVAHIDPDPMNCADENLLLLCQMHHNQLDAPMRAKNAKATRLRKKREAEEAAGVLCLPGVEGAG
jgi:hypothetical protein